MKPDFLQDHPLTTSRNSAGYTVRELSLLSGVPTTAIFLAEVWLKNPDPHQERALAAVVGSTPPLLFALSGTCVINSQIYKQILK